MRSQERLRFIGHVGWAVLATERDLGHLLPPGITAADPHKLLVKAYRLRRASVLQPAGGGRPPMHQYRQVCVSVVAGSSPASPLAEGMHYNLVMWNDRQSSFEANIEAGNRKRLADIEVTWSFPEIEEEIFGHADPRFEAVVSHSAGVALRLSLRHRSEPSPEPVPPYTGVISPLRTLTEEGMHEGAVLTRVEDVRHAEFAHADVELELGPGSEPFEAEALTALAGARALGGGVRFIGWDLPQNPHVVLASLPVGR